MNRISIKTKVTLWYTTLMVVLVSLMMMFIFFISKGLEETSTKNVLVGVVEDRLNKINYEDGEVQIDNDFDSFYLQVYLSVYSKDMQKVYGELPENLNSPLSFTDNTVRMVNNGNSKWYVYDSRVSFEEYGDIWVRGITAISDSESALITMLSIAGVTLPFLVVIVALGGYFITGQAFKPVRQINEAAERIGGGRDLSQRIPIGEGKDEIYTVAKTFNDMIGRLEQSFESEKQFTLDVSHELRTPVSAIVSQSEYALENAKTMEEAKDALSVVLTQARKISGLISHLLMLSRIDMGHKMLTLELLNLSELTEMVAEEQYEAANEKGIEIQTNITPGLHIQADETMMLRMLINLVSNAVTYGKSGGHIIIGLAKGGNKIIGSVADDGIGIAEEHLYRIWERFYQVNPSRTSTKAGGVGLGLSMVKWIVEAHSGSISVSSKLGEGSTFTFVLPLAQ
ncbi:signal transduction histidine kinase [Kineothrix alysoides]|uniref:histidine kinase n=1 Tax=Kineothrix alysoides TaxID=1469948 RepID=A0A4R1QPZ2_9FIRM|nr:HAMP domain-containing sensor histidine kinase [Kineothrix alysoides]TCL54425.1 signal transduction histidine kinase [Kineothrix alysoides]